MGRGKVEHETKREKSDFRLGGTQEERESKVQLPRGSHLEKKKTTKRELSVEKKIKRRE